MNTHTLFLSGCILAAAILSPAKAEESPRDVITLKEGWKFKFGPQPDGEKIGFDDSTWESVSVPHDWAIRGPFDKNNDRQIVRITQNMERKPTDKTGRTGALPHVGEGWYRKTFELPNFVEGQKVLILFDGAMAEPKVYLNGRKVGEWNYGYSYFYFDITDFINGKGDNTLAVHLTNREQASRWYPGAGLFRKVRIIVKNAESIDQWGQFITTPLVSDELAKVNVKTQVSGQNLRLVTDILDSNGNLLVSHEAEAPFGNEFDQNIHLPNPRLWSPETPYLYRAVSRIYQGDDLRDELTTTFGVRTFSFEPGKGFSLNGEVRKFKGVCLHHDLGPLGAAINTAALRRQILIMKEMGADAIRSAHNMPSIEQLELCDEMGMLFIAESFDEWERPKVQNGYHRYFATDVEKDIVNLVRATRNHPCIILWSSGNEVPDQHTSDGVKNAKRLQDIFHREDPTRMVTVGMDQVAAVMENGFGAIMDVPGLNYRLHLYEEAYERFPQGFLLGSETGSTVSSRGIYKFPVEKFKMKTYPDRQCSSYDLEYCNWSNLPDDDFVMQDDKEWVIGEFVWTGFDYLGEPTPYDQMWPSRSSYFGICDLAGIPKDRYYLYRSRWNKESPTLHVLPHWNWEGREGETTPIFAYTSYESAELFINGKSMGVKKKYRSTPLHRYRLMWMDVVYEPGEIRVVALDENGRPAMEKTVFTAGEPHQIVLEADRTTLKADGEDVSFITASVVDRNGRPCPTATNRLHFEVTGAGSYRAACNGDATSLELFHEPTMKLFSGKLVILVQSTKDAGEIELKVTSDKLLSETINLVSTQSL
ncbi:MAG: glycoside hydrolase family 2 TIM barrel-domain containing protein [Verrucomicrobiota bacterium]